MQFLARLMDHALEQRGERATIAVATSGHRRAAVEAFAGARYRPCRNLPNGRISEVRAHDTTTDDDNSMRCDRGYFRRLPGDCEKQFNHQLPRPRAALRRHPSIGAHRCADRLLLHCAVALGAPDRKVAFSGRREISATSSPLCRRPLGCRSPLVVATNVNDILARALASGVYELPMSCRPLAVDGHRGRIEFERCCLRPMALTAGGARLDASLAQSRRFAIAPPRFRKSARRLPPIAPARRSGGDDADRSARDRMLIDPHTAVGIAVAEKEARDSRFPMIVLDRACGEISRRRRSSVRVRPLCPIGCRAVRAPEHVTMLPADQGQSSVSSCGKPRRPRGAAA